MIFLVFINLCGSLRRNTIPHSMFRHPVSTLLAIICLFPATLSVAGQDDSTGDWRRFQNKDGQEIEAKPVALSPDLRSVQILRRDGRTFELTVTLLSLDDQQYLREWFMSQTPDNPEQLRFDFTVNRREKSIAREKLVTPVREALWETTELTYEVRMTSLSTSPIPGLHLEYALLVEDHIEVNRPDGTATVDPDEAAPRWRSKPEGEIRYRRGTIDLPVLSFNRPHIVDIGALVLDTVKTSQLEREGSRDEPVGLILRLVDASGNVIQEKSDLTRQFAAVNWTSVADRWDPKEEAGEGVLVEALAAN